MFLITLGKEPKEGAEGDDDNPDKPKEKPKRYFSEQVCLPKRKKKMKEKNQNRNKKPRKGKFARKTHSFSLERQQREKQANTFWIFNHQAKKENQK